MYLGYSQIFNVNTENVTVKKYIYIYIDIYYFRKENVLILFIKKCFLSLSIKEWNVVYYDISHHKLERPLFYKLTGNEEV